jgi:hypothetical protein
MTTQATTTYDELCPGYDQADGPLLGAKHTDRGHLSVPPLPHRMDD